MRSPIRITPSPGSNANATREIVAPLAGKLIVNSRQTGDPLPPTETVPDHAPAIPWPAANNSHNPIKLKGE